MHPVAGGAPYPPGTHAGAERPGHVRPHPYQHALPHQEGGEWHCGKYYSGNWFAIIQAPHINSTSANQHIVA